MLSTIVDASGINDPDRLMSLGLIESAINRLAGIDILTWTAVRGRQLKGLRRAELPGGIWHRGKTREAHLELRGDDLSLFIQWSGVSGMDLPFAVGGRAEFSLASGSRLDLLSNAMKGWADILQKPEIWTDINELCVEMQLLSRIARGLIASCDRFTRLEIYPNRYGEHIVITNNDPDKSETPWSIFDHATGLSHDLITILDNIVKDRIFITDDIMRSRHSSELPYISIGSPPSVNAERIEDPMSKMRAIANLPPGVQLLTPTP